MTYTSIIKTFCNQDFPVTYIVFKLCACILKPKCLYLYNKIQYTLVLLLFTWVVICSGNISNVKKMNIIHPRKGDNNVINNVFYCIQINKYTILSNNYQNQNTSSYWNGQCVNVLKIIYIENHNICMALNCINIYKYTD